MYRLAEFALLFLMAQSVQAADYFVATSGSDANPGSESAPWRTIQKAADSLQPNDTAWVRRGVYRERVKINVSGDSGAPITIASIPGERVIIDGRRFRPSGDISALLTIENQSHVVIRGLNFRHYSTTKPGPVPCGIFIVGACEGVEIRDSQVSFIRNTHRNGNAFGIAVYGTSATQSIRGLVLDGNNVHHLKTGFSESVAVNGNVTDFQVTNNRVHHNNNIGIDFIGYEGTCPDPAFDRARDGVCRGNHVWKISSRSNPAYRGDASAGGIYCDGATGILIERNWVDQSDLGVELASEHAGRDTSSITLRNNFISRSRVAGISLGGYDALRGVTRNCTVRNNTLFQNDTRRTGSGEIQLQHFVENCEFRQNVVFANRQGLFLGSQTTSLTGVIFDRQLYFTIVGAASGMWEWKGNSLEGFAAWTVGGPMETNAAFANPLLVDATSGDFHLRSGSPAIDAGDPAFVPAPGETDFDGESRISGSRADLGADEVVTSPL